MSTGMHQAISIPYARLDGIDIQLPKVNVIIGNYNQGQYIGDAIRSVAQQSYADFECIVVDDCSTDDSARVIEATLAELGDSRFRFVSRATNGGQMTAMYTGFDEGTAPFVAFLDADDIWLPTFLETHIACHLNPEINAAMSSSNLAVIDASGTVIAGSSPPFSDGSPAREKGPFVTLRIPKLRATAGEREASSAKIIFVGSDNHHSWLWSPTSGLVFRRVVVDAIRPENKTPFRSCADNYIASFAHLIGGSILVHEVHGYYRIHGDNMYAKHTVFGDHTRNGATPRSVTEATRTTMVAKLCKDPIFRGIMRSQHLGRVLPRLLKNREEVTMVLESKSLAPMLPGKTVRKLRRRKQIMFVGSLFHKGAALSTS
jgi:glycosyltransferase involved in cell wall biosynthesis